MEVPDGLGFPVFLVLLLVGARVQADVCLQEGVVYGVVNVDLGNVEVGLEPGRLLQIFGFLEFSLQLFRQSGRLFSFLGGVSTRNNHPGERRRLTKEPDHVVFPNHVAPVLLRRGLGDPLLVRRQLALELELLVGGDLGIVLGKEALEGSRSFFDCRKVLGAHVDLLSLPRLLRMRLLAAAVGIVVFRGIGLRMRSLLSHGDEVLVTLVGGLMLSCPRVSKSSRAVWRNRQEKFLPHLVGGVDGSWRAKSGRAASSQLCILSSSSPRPQQRGIQSQDAMK